MFHIKLAEALSGLPCGPALSSTQSHFIFLSIAALLALKLYPSIGFQTPQLQHKPMDFVWQVVPLIATYQEYRKWEGEFCLHYPQHRPQGLNWRSAAKGKPAA